MLCPSPALCLACLLDYCVPSTPCLATLPRMTSSSDGLAGLPMTQTHFLPYLIRVPLPTYPPAAFPPFLLYLLVHSYPTPFPFCPLPHSHYPGNMDSSLWSLLCLPFIYYWTTFTFYYCLQVTVLPLPASGCYLCLVLLPSVDLFLCPILLLPLVPYLACPCPLPLLPCLMDIHYYSQHHCPTVASVSYTAYYSTTGGTMPCLPLPFPSPCGILCPLGCLPCICMPTFFFPLHTWTTLGVPPL